MTAFLLVLVALLLVGSNQAMGYYFTHCDEQDIFECLFRQLDEPEPEGAVTATGTYTYKEYPVTITMIIPLEGGNVTGSVSGTCEGKVKGTFSGKQNGVISGKLTGACSPFFVNIPSSADFSGTVNKTGKKVPITFTGKGAGFTHEGSMSLSY